MLVSLIVAIDACTVEHEGRRVHGIGYRGKMPWPKLTNDLHRFRHLTWGKSVIMGAGTYESLGGPLKGRRNIVLSGDPEKRAKLSAEGAVAARTIQEAVAASSYTNDIFVIGGAQIYNAFLQLPKTDPLYPARLYVTEVAQRSGQPFRADTFFPALHFHDSLLQWMRLQDEEADLLGQYPCDKRPNCSTAFYVFRPFTDEGFVCGMEALAAYCDAKAKKRAEKKKTRA